MTAAVLLFAGSTAQANITIATASGNTPVGGPTTPPSFPLVTYTADGDGTVGFGINISYNTAQLDLASTDPNCTVNDAAGTVLVVFSDPNNNALVGSTTYCVVNATVPPSVPAGAVALTGSFGPGQGCFNAAAAPTTCTITNGAINVSTGPQPPTLNYNPPPGALTVPASLTPGTVTTTIAITTTGGDPGQTRALACGTVPAGFSAVVTGSPFAAGGSGSIGIGCTGTPAPGNLVCTETPGGTTRTYNLTCSSLPGYSSVPPIGGTVTLTGIQGGPATGGISVTNNGTAPLTITGCTPGGTAGFSVTSQFPINIAAGATGAISLGCTAPAAAGTSITGGTLTCATNAPGAGAAPNYNLTCTALSASIPTLGWGGKGLMVLLMLGLGLVGFQLYRRTA